MILHSNGVTHIQHSLFLWLQASDCGLAYRPFRLPVFIKTQNACQQELSHLRYLPHPSRRFELQTIRVAYPPSRPKLYHPAVDISCALIASHGPTPQPTTEVLARWILLLAAEVSTSTTYASAFALVIGFMGQFNTDPPGVDVRSIPNGHTPGTIPPQSKGRFQLISDPIPAHGVEHPLDSQRGEPIPFRTTVSLGLPVSPSHLLQPPGPHWHQHQHCRHPNRRSRGELRYGRIRMYLTSQRPELVRHGTQADHSPPGSVLPSHTDNCVCPTQRERTTTWGLALLTLLTIRPNPRDQRGGPIYHLEHEPEYR